MTPEQEAADAALHAAIEAHGAAFGWLDEGELLSTWVVAGSILPAQDGDDRQTGYFHAFRGDYMPHHEMAGFAAYVSALCDFGLEET